MLNFSYPESNENELEQRILTTARFSRLKFASTNSYSRPPFVFFRDVLCQREDDNEFIVVDL